MISKNHIKQVKALHLKKYREEQKLFIAEGKKIIDELVQYDPSLIRELFASREFITHRRNELDAHGIKAEEVSREELSRISTLSTPQDALAVCHYFKESRIAIDLTTQFSFYLDDIRDPGNLGTILRMADWFGISEIFCSKSSTEIYNPKTIQSAMGAFLRVKVHYVDLIDVINHQRVPVYGAVLNGENIYSTKLSPGLIIIGNEANGISEENLRRITHPITIPAATSNRTESLNAAVAGSIICSEFFRQLVIK
jgi:TrmH family RNA methyltransferase